MSSITLVKVTLKAKTEEQLSVAMLKNNMLRSAHYTYECQEKLDGTWVAWFYTDVKNEIFKKAIK